MLLGHLTLATSIENSQWEPFEAYKLDFTTELLDKEKLSQSPIVTSDIDGERLPSVRLAIEAYESPTPRPINFKSQSSPISRRKRPRQPSPESTTDNDSASPTQQDRRSSGSSINSDIASSSEEGNEVIDVDPRFRNSLYECLRKTPLYAIAPENRPLVDILKILERSRELEGEPKKFGISFVLEILPCPMLIMLLVHYLTAMPSRQLPPIHEPLVALPKLGRFTEWGKKLELWCEVCCELWQCFLAFLLSCFLALYASNPNLTGGSVSEIWSG
jgi:hypothetical protein